MKRFLLAGFCILTFLSILGVAGADMACAQDPLASWFLRKDNHPALGAWFGRAAPGPGSCTPGSTGCPLPPEVFMVLNIWPDGSFSGNDSLTFLAPHTEAHGMWAPLNGSQIMANYVLLQGNPGGGWAGTFRMRWLATLQDQNSMTGYVEVWFSPFVNPATGVANIDPKTWVPIPDPLVPLGKFITDPKDCNPAKGCFGIFNFKLRRVTDPLSEPVF